jgi:spermidine synthase
VNPLRVDVDALEARLNRPDSKNIVNSLMDAEINTATDLLGTYAGRAEDLQEWMAGAEINEDRNLRLQYLAGMANNTYQGPSILRGILNHYKFPADVFTGSATLKQSVRQAIEIPRRIQTASLPVPSSSIAATP